MIQVAYQPNITYSTMVQAGPVTQSVPQNYNYGKYNIIGHLGGGGFGTVYQVQHTNGYIYAMKKCKPRWTADDSAMTEVKVLLSLKGHPHIVNMFDYFTDPMDSTLNIVMEICNGGNLEQYFIRNQSPLQNTLIFMLQMAHAVQFIHSKGIVHRDLKPENVLLEIQNGTVIVKIADFGIAKIGYSIHSGPAPINYMETTMGTRSYMAPEHIDGKYTEKVDIFSLGIIYCAILECMIIELPDKNKRLVIFYSQLDQRPIGEVLRTGGQPRSINTWVQINTDIRNLINQMIAPYYGHRPDAAQVTSVLLSRWNCY